MKRRAEFLFAAALALSLAVVSCRPLFHREVSGIVLQVEGRVEASTKDKSFRLTNQSRLYPGTLIDVPAGDRVDLKLLPGILVEGTGESQIQIEQLRLSRDGDETIRPMIAREATLRLTHGTLLLSVGRAPTHSRLRVVTPFGTLTTGAGRVCKLTVTAAGGRVLSVRGINSFAPVSGGPPVQVGAGFFYEAPGSNRPPQPASQSGSEAEAELADTLIAEGRLLRIGREREPFVPWKQEREASDP